jgi:hypothetical protein
VQTFPPTPAFLGGSAKKRKPRVKKAILPEVQWQPSTTEDWFAGNKPLEVEENIGGMASVLLSEDMVMIPAQKGGRGFPVEDQRPECASFHQMPTIQPKHLSPRITRGMRAKRKVDDAEEAARVARAIAEVLADIKADEDMDLDNTAPESQHTIDSMHTPMRDSFGFPVHTFSAIGDGFVLPEELVDTGRFEGWSTKHEGYQLMVPNIVLVPEGERQGMPFCWVSGTVVAEFLEGPLQNSMVACQLEGYPNQMYVPLSDCRLANGPRQDSTLDGIGPSAAPMEITPHPSVAVSMQGPGMLKPTWSRISWPISDYLQYSLQGSHETRSNIRDIWQAGHDIICENPPLHKELFGWSLGDQEREPVPMSDTRPDIDKEDEEPREPNMIPKEVGQHDAESEGNDTDRSESDSDDPNYTNFEGSDSNNGDSDRVHNTETESDEDATRGTQESTCRTPFPQVTITSLPAYISEHCRETLSDSGDGSTGEEWVAEPHDLDISDDGSDVELVDDGPPFFDHEVHPEVTARINGEFDQWATSEASYKPVSLDLAGLQNYYQPSMWNSTSVRLLGSRNNFSGPTPGYAGAVPIDLPNPTLYWNMYWDDTTLDRIAQETNRYALVVLDNGKPRGGNKWKPVTICELRIWFGILILMGVKKMPCRRHYWMRGEQALYCGVIPKAMSLVRWELIKRCLHLIDNAILVKEKSDPNFDRLAKTRWLLNHFVTVSESIYNLEREVTIDECIIPYKGKYCQIRQFMKGKPTRFGIKVWCLASSHSRFISRIEVYEGKGTGLGPHGLGYHVVSRLIEGLDGRGHVVVVDNLFASVNLFHELMVRGFWGTGTVKLSSKNLPRASLKRDSDPQDKGNVVIKMHQSRQITAISWQDHKLVSMLSTAADAWAPETTVLRREKGKRMREKVPSTPVHVQYTEFMRGVDVADQLRVAYSIQMRGHKWWFKKFGFVLDQSLVNMFIMYQDRMIELGLRPLFHMLFNIQLARYLLQGALDRNARRTIQIPQPRHPRPPHVPKPTKLRRPCMHCGKPASYYCDGCGTKWIHNKTCYFIVHPNL